ncbi:MAG: chorismate synthase [Bacilli bacterium]|nr:chorismate synthase [Bacilli bacterium]
MASNIGNVLKITIFGESHGKAVGLVIDGLPAGFQIDTKEIEKDLQKRNPKDELSTPRHEVDEINWLSGINLQNMTTEGTPLAFTINNEDISSKDYEKGQIRPGTADLVSLIKADGNNDYRGAGFRSGRITAPLAVLGSICKQLLAKKGIKIATHIAQIEGVFDKDFDFKTIDFDIEKLNNSLFAVLDENKSEQMKNLIKNAAKNKDSLGGILETVATGLPIGLGEPYFDSLDAYVSRLFFSVGGVKGVLFGDGIDFANKPASEMNDQLEKDDNSPFGFRYLSNHSGGVTGGYSDGKPLVIKTVVKATPSIGKEQKSIKIEGNNIESINLNLKGRFDPSIIQRVRVVLDSLLAFAILDLMMLDKGRKL